MEESRLVGLTYLIECSWKTEVDDICSLEQWYTPECREQSAQDRSRREQQRYNETVGTGNIVQFFVPQFQLMSNGVCFVI